ncbi:MAG: hypothetical protein JSV19_04240 [Phycisphaerales bacterium]|nr:MAG: hypothetical protein JSV19_04240 [Phycisphaerales bacterium]
MSISTAVLIVTVLVAWTIAILGLRRENPSRSWLDLATAGPTLSVALGLGLNFLFPLLGTVIVGGLHVILLILAVVLIIRGPRTSKSEDDQ